MWTVNQVWPGGVFVPLDGDGDVSESRDLWLGGRRPIYPSRDEVDQGTRRC